MPLDRTEKSGSRSNLLLQYENETLTSPGMTLEQMKNIVNAEMRKLNLPDHIIQ